MPIELLAWIGYGARGLVYILVGGLAVLAFGPRGATTGGRGALRVMLEQPLGWAWLGLIGLGLAFFALWRLAQAVLDVDKLGTSWKMLGRRIAYFISAIINGSLAFFAVNLALGQAIRSQSEEGAVRDWTAWLMQQPDGAWAVMAIGAGIVIAFTVLFWQVWQGDRVIEFLDCPADKRRWAVPAGRLGGALDSLAAQPNGWMLLGATAAGLMAFGAFCRRIKAPRLEDAPDAVARVLISATRAE